MKYFYMMKVRILVYDDNIGRQEALLQDELSGMRQLAAEQLVPQTRVRALELRDAIVRRGRHQTRDRCARLGSDGVRDVARTAARAGGEQLHEGHDRRGAGVCRRDRRRHVNCYGQRVGERGLP